MMYIRIGSTITSKKQGVLSVVQYRSFFLILLNVRCSHAEKSGSKQETRQSV